MGINKVILVGNVGKDPVVQYVREDLPVARFSLATSESYRNKDGERVTKTEWHNIVVWRGLAKVVEQYVKKGNQLYLEGKITNRSYEKDGATRYISEIVVDNMEMLDRAKDGASNGSSQTSSQQQSQVSNAPQEENMYDGGAEFSETDDLPF